MKRIYICLLLVAAVLGSSSVYAQSCIGGVLKVTPASLNFAQVDIGSSKSKFLTIKNNSATGGPLDVQSVVALDSQFTVNVTQPLPSCMGPGKTLLVEVIFAPDQIGRTDSRIRIISSDASSPHFMAISGIGVGSEFQVSPTSLDFGTVNVGQTVSKTFNILNKGGAAGTVDMVTSNNNAFVVATSFPKSIGPGGQVPVNVDFTPSKSGSFKGAITVKSGGQTIDTVAVTGAGASGNPEIGLSTTQIDCGTLDIGTYAEKTLGISNSGNSDLQVKLVPDTNVKVNPAGPLSIAPGKSQNVKVRCIADKVGPISKSLKLNSNDPDEAQLNVTLNAVGVLGQLGLLDMTKKSRVGNNRFDTSGIQWVDYNGDGREDVFLTGKDGNVLFKNMGGGMFSNVTNRSKLGSLGKDTRGASWADVDNDGDPDVFLANFGGPSTIMKNNKGVFANQGLALGIFSADNTPAAQGGIWLDFNNDGRLDLFVVKDGKPNQLFKQTGIFQFVEVATSAGLALNSSGKSAVAADFNNDGYQDLYVANFNKPNKLYINNKNETFRDATNSARVGFNGASQQVTVSDYDGDGDFDLFVANSDGTSVLYRNTGNLKFQNATNLAGLAAPKGVRGASFADFDNDGDQDLLIIQPSGQTTLYRNNGSGKFIKAGNVDVSSPSDPTSTSTADTDNDGLPDVGLGGSDGSGDSVYQNTGGDGMNWLVVVLRGTQSNRAGIGAKVILRAGLSIQAMSVTAGNGQSQDSLPLEFGLGNATSASLVITWPSGKVQMLNNVAANQKLNVTEPTN